MTSTNRSLVVDVFDRVVNGRDFDYFDELTTEDYTDHANPATFMPTREGTKMAWRMMVTAFPDLSVEILDLLAEGDRVAVRVRSTGRHEGVFGDIEPTGNRLALESMMIWRIEEGKLAERWALSDTGAMAHQLGFSAATP